MTIFRMLTGIKIIMVTNKTETAMRKHCGMQYAVHCNAKRNALRKAMRNAMCNAMCNAKRNALWNAMRNAMYNAKGNTL